MRTAIIAVAAILIVIEAALLLSPEAEVTGHAVGTTLPASPLSLNGYEQVTVSVSPSIIYLTAGCRQLAMITTDFQTFSIQHGLDKTVDVRPTSHDVMADIIDSFGGEVQMVRIDLLDGSTYYSKLVIRDSGRILALDTRPSDGIAVAVRYDAPVYIHESILATQGKDVC
ncbi:MAG: bifunctional nuclease family protein [Candidatus Aenigmarchaeota archaeon]|nr:bifunctional nuclease family protein [Candidatus Aenigmarchaeota archaeon]